LDFVNFDITDVAATGVCTDSFVVTTTTGRNPRDLCGTLTDSHSNYTPLINWLIDPFDPFDPFDLFDPFDPFDSFD
jgi:hypothetical protein